MSLIKAYLRAIKSMEGDRPEPLQDYAVFVAGRSDDSAADVSLTALCAYMEGATANEPLRKELHLAIAGWDAVEEVEWAEATKPHTVERRHRVYELLGLDKPTAEAFDAAFPLIDDGTVVISDEFEPWYTSERRAAHEFYWRAYKRYLLSKGWDPLAITELDTATTEVVERLSDPTRPQAYQSKGLVVGYVQSGKTANFTGVVAKAIDAGYRLVIVLTGTVDILRKQTQRRVDMEVVGVENIYLGADPDELDLAKSFDYLDDEDRLKGKFLMHGFRPSERGFPNIVRLTSHGSDYRDLNAGITALELQKRNRQKPLFDDENLFASDARLAVVKKNASVLSHLTRNLKNIQSHLGEIPTLIIDDESDQASINTSNPKHWAEGQKERTTINRLISGLLRLLPRSQYVGYTATPYANVFIDPSDAEDIFPKDFLLSLGRPRDYMGVADFHDLDANSADIKDFQNSNEKAFVRGLHASGADADNELQGALDAFLLSGAIKLYRAEQDSQWDFRHHTMLVHESVRTAEHRDLAERVRHIWASGGYMTSSGQQRLARLLESDFRPVSEARAPELPFPEKFDDLKPFVGKTLSKIQESAGNPVLIVNGDRDLSQQDLDFQSHSVWRILVGGAKLSRGFTIEGLTVSYYRRRTKQGDTLMQMGRWFGFRRGYRDLVRLYIGRAEPDGKATIDLYKAFEAILQDEESFRSELRRYAKLVDGHPQITPKDIPPIVSQHFIPVTGRNRMFNAELVIRRSPGEMAEPTAYPDDPAEMARNYAIMLPLVQAADAQHHFSYPTRTLPSGSIRRGGEFDALVGIVPAQKVLEVLSELRWQPEDRFKPDLEYLREITPEAVKDWVVIAPQQRDKRELEGLGRRSVFTRQRRYGNLFGALSEPGHRPPAERIAGARPSWGDKVADSLVRERRGAMLIYPVAVEASMTDPSDVVFVFALWAPWAAQAANGQVVQFRAKDSGSPRAAIVATSPTA